MIPWGRNLGMGTNEKCLRGPDLGLGLDNINLTFLIDLSFVHCYKEICIVFIRAFLMIYFQLRLCLAESSRGYKMASLVQKLGHSKVQHNDDQQQEYNIMLVLNREILTFLTFYLGIIILKCLFVCQVLVCLYLSIFIFLSQIHLFLF